MATALHLIFWSSYVPLFLLCDFVQRHAGKKYLALFDRPRVGIVDVRGSSWLVSAGYAS